MIALLSLALPGDARSRVFLDSPALLREMIEYVHAVVAERMPAVVVANPDVLPFLSDVNLSADVIVDRAPAGPEGVADWALTVVNPSPDEPLLVVSPFLGVVSPERLDAFLEHKGGGCPLISARPVTANVNPFWMNMISPTTRVGRSSYVDRNKTKLPKFTQTASIINQERWRELIGDLEIYGSQWLPKLHKLDGALALVQSQAGDFSPVLLDEPGLEGLPLLYQLPLFDMATDIPASLRRSVPSENGTIRLEQARTAMRSMGYDDGGTSHLPTLRPAGHYRS
ncbi:hypothetical protein [Pseudodesulfovibrio methanolicus]|uniref:ABC transporter substrate-binding protein n=1 Tax=Pseudodesulfovibrio methanolicus TaxID=3126690 RepID=A0ABZ2J1Y5_9BACT